jgi:hypothetical protein
MENVKNANGHAGHSLIKWNTVANAASDNKPMAKDVLCKWYRYLKDENNTAEITDLFSHSPNDDIAEYLTPELATIPDLLMDEWVSKAAVLDKGQYLKLVQALLVNISDLIFEKYDDLRSLCPEAERVLEFMQDFFYREFDFDYRVSAFCLQEFHQAFQLKLDYWKLKLKQSAIIDTLHECMNEKMLNSENHLSFRKLSYLKNLFHCLETITTIISEENIRELLIYYNFNSGCYIDYEKQLIKQKLNDAKNAEENIAALRNEQQQISGWKIKHNICFETDKPSIKKQLHDWITLEIKQLQLTEQKSEEHKLIIDPDAKIQTSLSVAKLAVLIRLFVADKIIINKTVAPMLRTVSKLFTTLQKDEISFGSLETKYHAPDKATLNIMKEMMQKWVKLSDKL